MYGLTGDFAGTRRWCLIYVGCCAWWKYRNWYRPDRLVVGFRQQHHELLSRHVVLCFFFERRSATTVKNQWSVWLNGHYYYYYYYYYFYGDDGDDGNEYIYFLKMCVLRIQHTWQICDGWSKQFGCRCRLQLVHWVRSRQRGHIPAAVASAL